MKKIALLLALLLPDAPEAQTISADMVQGPDGTGTMKEHTSGWVNVKTYGAVGDGVTDDTAAIQVAINYAVGMGRRLVIPSGSYLVSNVSASEVLRIEGPLSIKGDGQLATLLIVKSTVPASADILHYVATTAGGFKHFSISDFGVVPQSGTPGRYAINIDTTTGPIANVTVSRLYVEQLSGGSLRNTNPTLSDGFFTSTIRENVFVGGILFDRAGDSIRIQNNTITGNGIGIDWDSVSGASVGMIGNNNITTKDSAIRLRQSYRTIIRDNNLEPHTGGGYSGNPVINVSGSVATVYEPRIEGNTILASLVSNVDAISFDDALNPVVGPNTIYTAGSGVGVKATANTVGLKVDRTGSAWAVGPTQISDASGQVVERFYVSGVNGAATFTGPLHLATATGATQTGSVYQGSGAPNNANGNNGDVYLRTDTPGTANQRIYVKSAGAWAGIL